MNDGNFVDYDYLVIATGPKLASTKSRDWPHVVNTYPYPCRSRLKSHDEWEQFCKNPAHVVGAVQGASCFGPAYEYAFIMIPTCGAARSAPKCDDLWSPRTLYRPPWPGRRGRFQGYPGSGMRDKHIKWICNAKVTKVEAGNVCH